MITERKNDRRYYLAGDPVLVKDRRRSKTYSID
jgi:hypothetical protein